MDLQATVLLKNLPGGMELDEVERTLRGAVCEWLDYDRHPDDIHGAAKYLADPDAQRAPLEDCQRPLYCVSDLHLGDGGPRDNFAAGDKLAQFYRFLDHVEHQNGRLIILGDLFEFWQANVSRVITRHMPLLNRLGEMGAHYVLGNHDADLLYFWGTGFLRHELFNNMRPVHAEVIGSHWIKFVHGHQADPYCASDVPGKGRIAAIYSGIWEDRNGSPWIGKYRTVEEALATRADRLLSLFYRLLGRPNRRRQLNRHLRSLYPNYDMIVSGHTHRAGSSQTNEPFLYNTGTWAERVNSYVCIQPDGSACVLDWVDGEPVRNHTELLV